MLNEIIFLIYILVISTNLLIALKISKEALISLICVQVILVNLFVVKEIRLFNLIATASDALSVGITLGLNLLQEYFSKKDAQKTVWISFLCSIFYSIVTKLHLLYKPDTQNFNISQCFNMILGSTPRIIIASLVVYLITQNLDCLIYNYLTNKVNKKYFILKNYGSAIITQFLDTVLFSFFGLYKINQNFNSVSIIVQIIIISYTIKLIVIFIATPFLALSKKLFNKLPEN